MHVIEGHAIISREGAIADADGVKCACLQVDADWRYFQRQLDDSALTVIGRNSHEADPDSSGRRRLVITSRAAGLEQVDQLTWRLDPDRSSIGDALSALAPDGGRVAVVGGRRVFDLLLEHGFDGFHMTVAGNCSVSDGVPVFTGVASADAALDRLDRHGLVNQTTRVLDASAGAILHHLTRS